MAFVLFQNDLLQGKTSVILKLLEREGEETKPTLALDYTFGRKFGKNQVHKIFLYLIFINLFIK